MNLPCRGGRICYLFEPLAQFCQQVIGSWIFKLSEVFSGSFNCGLHSPTFKAL
jgi:hypothetical protein